MRCRHCHAENRPGARFCGTCGEPLDLVAQPSDSAPCATCGAAVKPGARFCPRCGTDLGEGARVEDDAASRPTLAPAPGWGAEAAAHGAVPEGQPAGRAPWDMAPAMSSAPVAGGALPGTDPVGPPPWEAPVKRRRAAWPLAIVVALLSGTCFLCAALGFAAAPAFGGEVRPQPPIDPTRPDLTIRVEEAYISDMVLAAMPAGLGGDPQLDVQPGNLIVVTMEFPLLIIRLEVAIHARIGVEDGQMRVWIERIETGGQNLLDLIGIDQITLGDEITGIIQKVLEDELGPGSRLLSVSTDESRVILTARWE